MPNHAKSRRITPNHADNHAESCRITPRITPNHAESRRITPNHAESRQITPNHTNGLLPTEWFTGLAPCWAGEPGRRFKTTSFLPTKWFTGWAPRWAGELSRRSKTKSYRLQNDPLVWHTTGLESPVGCLKPHHSIHYLPITQTKPYYDDIKYPILHHILFKLYCWLNGSVVFGQRGTFVSIGMNSLRTTRLNTDIQTKSSFTMGPHNLQNTSGVQSIGED